MQSHSWDQRYTEKILYRTCFKQKKSLVVTPSSYDAGTQASKFYFAKSSSIKILNNFNKIIIDNKIKEGFKLMKFWLTRKLIKILHLILELESILLKIQPTRLIIVL